MSSVKITQLPFFTVINANTANTIFAGVDIPTDTTFQMTAHTLAQGLYSNEILNVGGNPVLFSNTIAQFSGSDSQFLQVNLQNFNANGSADYILTADVGTNSTNYIDLGINNSQFSNVGYTSMYPLDGYLYVQDGGTAGGNLVIGTAATNSHINFISGGTNQANIVAKITANSLSLQNSANLIFSDGTLQFTAAASNAYSQAAFALANTVNAGLYYQAGVDVSQNTNITAVNNYTTSAYNQANVTAGGLLTANSNINIIQGVNAIQNTNIQNAWTLANTSLQNTATITVNNSIVVPNTITTSNLTVTNLFTSNNGISYLNTSYFNGYINITNSSYNPNNALIKISAATNGASQPTANSDYLMQLTGRDNVSARIIVDSFSATGNSYALVAGRSGRGSANTPSATQAGDVLMRISGNGYGATGFNGIGVTHIDVVATENFTDINHGAQVVISTTANGTNTLSQIASFSGNSATFSGYVYPTKGFIYTPNIYPSSQTAITIDFANNSVVRAQTTSSLAATLSNLVTGKVVDAWITNTNAGPQTFTHGVSATNSTVNATTYSIPGTSTIYVKYWSMDGTLTNTFCAIVHA